MYDIGDMVICEGDSELYLYLGLGAWQGWGHFLRLNDGHKCQMAMMMCSRWV